MTTGDHDMNIQRPSFKNEWNWNTVSVFIGFAIMIAGGGVAWQKTQGNVESVMSDLAMHQRISEAEKQAMNIRVKELETETRQIANINYRLTAVEQFGSGVTVSLREMQNTVNDINSEMRVMREILQRMDPSPRLGNAHP